TRQYVYDSPGIERKGDLMTRTWKQGLLAMPGIGVALLPKLFCPLCWPLYAGVVSSVGLGFLVATTYLIPIPSAFLVITLAVLDEPVAFLQSSAAVGAARFGSAVEPFQRVRVRLLAGCPRGDAVLHGSRNSVWHLRGA